MVGSVVSGDEAGCLSCSHCSGVQVPDTEAYPRWLHTCKMYSTPPTLPRGSKKAVLHLPLPPASRSCDRNHEIDCKRAAQVKHLPQMLRAGTGQGQCFEASVQLPVLLHCVAVVVIFMYA